jgi:hypothetical protein
MDVTERLTETAKNSSKNGTSIKSRLEMENMALEKLQMERDAVRDRELAMQRKVQDDVNRQIR